MLELSGSSATIASLPSLKKMHQLKHLFISSPKLTAKQLAQMQQALPGCRVDQAVQPKLPLEIFEPLH
jgi:hypothetical protein